MKGWPDRKADVVKVFRLQALYIELEAQRFEYVISESARAGAEWSSLSRIHERLHTNWGAGDESSLADRSQKYKRIVAEIADLLSSWDATAIDGPLRDVQQDAEFRSAEWILGERTRELDAQLARLASVL